jgi:hypothetical protein
LYIFSPVQRSPQTSAFQLWWIAPYLGPQCDHRHLTRRNTTPVVPQIHDTGHQFEIRSTPLSAKRPDVYPFKPNKRQHHHGLYAVVLPSGLLSKSCSGGPWLTATPR